LPFAYSTETSDGSSTIVVPPFTGVDAVRGVDGLGNAAGFIPVDDEFRHPQFKDIYSAGVAVGTAPPGPTAVPAGVPKTGHMSETMAKVAARNIAADLRGGERSACPCPISRRSACSTPATTASSSRQPGRPRVQEHRRFRCFAWASGMTPTSPGSDGAVRRRHAAGCAIRGRGAGPGRVAPEPSCRGAAAHAGGGAGQSFARAVGPRRRCYWSWSRSS
jgi:hypothetical protein